MPDICQTTTAPDATGHDDIVGVCAELRARLTSRITIGALDYWLAAVSDGRLPGRQHLDPAGMIPFLPHVLLMDVAPDGSDFRYRLVGTRVRYHLFNDPTGLWLGQIPHQKAPSIIHSAMTKCARSRLPMIGAVPYVGPHKDYKQVEDIQMPLARDGRNVDMLFIVVDYIRRG